MLTVTKQSINLKLEELRYLSNMFHVVQNQLTTFIIALSDVMHYVSIALSSTVYVEPTAAKHPTLINYAQLYEDLKTLLDDSAGDGNLAECVLRLAGYRWKIFFDSSNRAFITDKPFIAAGCPVLHL
jgi:hypothetical protein